MKLYLSILSALISAAVVIAEDAAIASDSNCNLTFKGISRNNIEIFYNIKYGDDTSGPNRFKPPRPFSYPAGSTVDATKPGPACPQPLGMWFAPLTLNNITEISEDCLSLNVARPANMIAGQKLPVMVWIHGGSFWVGSNMEPTHQPDGLVIESVKNKFPVIHVAMNYRLGFFGFAQSETLKKEGSENAGLRDQRAAIEWVRDHIAAFGGDPEKITIFGQSSGGLAVGLQLMAYGGKKPLPYQQGICQSQALEPGITGKFTIDAMTLLANYIGCNSTSVHSPETISCLRSKCTQELFDASFATYTGDISHNIGDIWLPVVDGDFLPAPPSQLLEEGRFGNAVYVMGWTQGDVNFFTDVSIASNEDTYKFIQAYLPSMPSEEVDRLLDLYPVGEFTPPAGTNLTAEFYRAARVFRDIIMVCEPVHLANAMKKNGNTVYLYDFNQTILEPILTSLYNVSHMGVVHTSEFAYMYGNLSHWNVSDYPWNPTQSDYDLLTRASRSWSNFASWGEPSSSFSKTLQGWKTAFWNGDRDVPAPSPNNTYVYVIGGPKEGISPFDGPEAFPEIAEQKLRERCGFINDPKIIEYLNF